MAKPFFNICSITTNSNKVITKNDLSFLKTNSLFKIRGDYTFYNILKISQVNIIKEFKNEETGFISIKDNLNNQFSPDDIVSIKYNLHAMDLVIHIESHGAGYRPGDILIAEGGFKEVLVETGNVNPICIKVDSVTELGKVEEFSIISHGLYIQTPPTKLTFYGGNGNGLILNTSYKRMEDKIIERRITNIQNLQDKSIIVFDNLLPKGVTNGLLTLKKWELLLSAPYTGKTNPYAEYEIINNFTPNYGLPFLIRNSLSESSIYNKTISILDSKIKELEDKINELSKQK